TIRGLRAACSLLPPAACLQARLVGRRCACRSRSPARSPRSPWLPAQTPKPRGSAAQQPLEQRVRPGDEDALLARVALVVAARETARLPLVARAVDDERPRVGGVRR